MKTLPALNDFLSLNIGSATDAYLRELALVAIQSRHWADTVEKLSAYQNSLELNHPAQQPLPLPVEAEAPKGKLIEGRYWVAEDSTVLDKQTGLMWMQSALPDTFTFAEAQWAVQNLNAQKGYAGHTDWRMPSQDELLSLVVEGNYPCICQEAFTDTPEAWFWTGTHYPENIGDAWTVYFGYGGVYSSNQYFFNHVRLVR